MSDEEEYEPGSAHAEALTEHTHTTHQEIIEAAAAECLDTEGVKMQMQRLKEIRGVPCRFETSLKADSLGVGDKITIYKVYADGYRSLEFRLQAIECVVVEQTEHMFYTLKSALPMQDFTARYIFETQKQSLFKTDYFTFRRFRDEKVWRLNGGSADNDGARTYLIDLTEAQQRDVLKFLALSRNRHLMESPLPERRTWEQWFEFTSKVLNDFLRDEYAQIMEPKLGSEASWNIAKYQEQNFNHVY